MVERDAAVGRAGGRGPACRALWPHTASPHALSPTPPTPHPGAGLQVAGSRAADVGTKGQRADHRIVEVALFFQQEVLQEAGPSGADPGRTLEAAAFPVLLLSGDNAQVRRSGGPMTCCHSAPQLSATHMLGIS